MNLLVLTSNLPYPPTDGWRIRTYQLLRALASRHRVTLLSFRTPGEDTVALNALGQWCSEVEVVDRTPRYGVRNLAAGLVGPTPFSILNYRSARMRLRLAELLARSSYDALHVEDIHMAQYVGAVVGLPRVLDMHNVESLLLGRYAEIHRDPLRRLYGRLTAAKLGQYEKRCAPLFDQVLTCSEVDRRHAVDTLGCARVCVVPNGVDVRRFSPDPGREEAWTLVFVGRMDYVANEDAVVFFSKEILPVVWRARPQVRLYVVGQRPSREVQALGVDPRIIVTGFVPDVREFIARATIVIAPVRYGSGTRIKILEAMAMAKPVVSTPVGCEGLDVTPGDELLVADSSDSFANCLIQLFGSDEVRQHLGQRGRQRVLQRYDWPIIGKALLGIYERLGSSDGPGRG